MTLALLCQLIVFFYSKATLLRQAQRLTNLIERTSKQTWQDRSRLLSNSFGLGDRVKIQENRNKWHAFAKEAIEEEQSPYVKDNLIHFANP